MLKLSNPTNNIGFGAKVSVPKMIVPAAAFLCCMAGTPMKADTFEKTSDIEVVDSSRNNTAIDMVDLANAPSPVVEIAGKQKKVGIVVDLAENKLYRYDSDGNVVDGYSVGTGRIGRNGKSITGTGIRRVHHVENYPYSSAPGTKRSRNPKAYGPNVLYLTIINPKTGVEEGSNGEFIHGNNDASSIGKYVSHGCIRMDNDVIKQFAREVKKGTLVLIK